MSFTTSLPLGDVNVVVVTDVHSWVGGHGRHEPRLDADYGDVLSFVQGLKENSGKDVFFVMNGDFVDGTGLSAVPPDHLTQFFNKCRSTRNHELYHNQTMEFLHDSGFIDHWNGSYLTSNTLWKETEDFIGHPYTYLYGYHSNTTVLTFGFLYNFESNCESTIVRKVQQTTGAKWFRQVLLRRDYDAILVLAHMDAIDPLVGHVHRSIRALVGSEMPVQFINGHSHRRAFHVYDESCTAMEAGRFLDTIGFVSFPILDSVVRASRDPRNLFNHVFLDANKKILQEASGGYNKTMAGNRLTDLIHQTQNSLGLEGVLGCASQTYWIGRPLNASDSLYGLYMHQVFPFAFEYNASRVFVQSAGALRYSLLQGEVTVDDLIAVSPFEDLIYLVAKRITGSELLAAFGNLMETNRDPQEWPFPYILSGSGTIDPQHGYDVYAAEYDLSEVQRRIERVTGRKLGPAALFGHDDRSLITTSTVWQNFFVSNWPCAATVSSHRLVRRESNICFVWYALTATVIGLSLYLLLPRVTRRKSTTGYEGFRKSSRDYGAIT